MSKELTTAQKREWAEMLFMQNQLSQKEIAAKVKSSEATISSWAKKYNWDLLRKSLLTSKGDILRNLYNFLDRMNKKLNEEEGFGDTKLADMYVKYTAAIRNLETETSIAQLMESGMQYHKYLQNIDPALAMNHLNHFDAFIKDKMKAQ